MKKPRPAFLVYKCEHCGLLDEPRQVPDGDAAINVLGGFIAVQYANIEWLKNLRHWVLHICGRGSDAKTVATMGIARFVGVRFLPDLDEPDVQLADSDNPESGEELA